MKSTWIVLLVFSELAFAGWKDIDSREFKVGDPPTSGSQTEQQDFVKLLELQSSRTDADCQRGARMPMPDYSAFFNNAPVLSPAEFQRARPLIVQVMGFTDRVTKYYKDHYRRPRPYDVDHRVQPCVRLPGGSKSYPSSHASTARAATCVMALIFPEKISSLRAYGDALGDLRVVIGVHHPSDVAAGKDLGQAICERLQAEPDFKAELTGI